MSGKGNKAYEAWEDALRERTASWPIVRNDPVPPHMRGTDNATGIKTMLAKLERDTQG